MSSAGRIASTPPPDQTGSSQPQASSSRSALVPVAGSSRTKTEAGATHTRWPEREASESPPPGGDDDEAKPLTVSEILKEGRSRQRPQLISCAIRYGKEQCDAKLASSALYAKHLYKVHGGRVRRELEAGNPIPEIKVGSHTLKWHDLNGLQKEFKAIAILESTNFCALKGESSSLQTATKQRTR